MTLVVYPALASTDRPRWVTTHDAHGKAITPVVVLTYAALLAACGWSIAAMPQAAGVWIAAGGAALAMAATASVAAPTHGKLSNGPDPILLRRLLAADRVRLVGAAIAVAGAALLNL